MTIVTGFKATDHNMQCRGYQFTPGEWHECEGELELCGNGFHFCKHPSGPWAYYSDPGTRIWKVEADGVLADGKAPGADYKLVARRIRLVEEVLFDGNCNTGNCNTGNCNTGNCNTGHGNTGNCNTDNCNTGNCNTGNRNTGHGNTGNCNTGNFNTGDRNTGDRNTGNGNATNYSSGFFCQSEPTVISFDCDSGLLREEFMRQYQPLVNSLVYELSQDEQIQFEAYRSLPGITPEKLRSLHQKFIDARKKR